MARGKANSKPKFLSLFNAFCHLLPTSYALAALGVQSYSTILMKYADSMHCTLQSNRCVITPTLQTCRAPAKHGSSLRRPPYVLRSKIHHGNVTFLACFEPPDAGWDVYSAIRRNSSLMSSSCIHRSQSFICYVLGALVKKPRTPASRHPPRAMNEAFYIRSVDASYPGTDRVLESAGRASTSYWFAKMNQHAASRFWGAHRPPLNQRCLVRCH